jgi:hypothetical protein
MATLIASAFLSASEAKAFVVTSGETIFHVGDVPSQNRPRQVAADKVGYKFYYWGVLWLDLWTSDGTFCLYEGKQYRSISRADAARLLGKPEGELRKPFLYTVPLGWLVYGPLIALGMLAHAIEKRRAGILPLFQDPRYQKALEIVQAEYAKPPEESATAASADERWRAAFEAGVRHLVGEGVPREEAERHLASMVNAMTKAPGRSPAPRPAEGKDPGSGREDPPHSDFVSNRK